MAVTSLIVDDEGPARRRIKKLLAADERFHLVGEAEDGGSAVTLIRSLRPQLLFLDIQLKDMTGFEVLGEVRSSFRGNVIFITAYDEFAIRAFEANATDYLLKPFKNARFQTALDRIYQMHAGGSYFRLEHLLDQLAAVKRDAGTLKIREGSVMHHVEANQLIFVKSEGYYANFHLEGSDKPKVIRISLKQTEKILPENFLRLNRSVIINRHKISWVKKLKRTMEVEMTSGQRFVTRVIDPDFS